MRKIINILFIIGCLFMMCSCRYSSDEKQVLKEYEKLSTSDFNNKYEYLKDNNNVFVSIKYEDLINKLEDDTFILYIGGPWCPNCQAIVKFVNEVAKELSIEKVYNFDTRISSVKTGENDIRNCNNEAQTNLYRTLIEELEYVNPNGVTTEGTDIDRLAVPAIFVIKDGKVAEVIVKEYLYNEETDVLYINGDEKNYKDEYLALLKEAFIKIN